MDKACSKAYTDRACRDGVYIDRVYTNRAYTDGACIDRAYSYLLLKFP